MDDFEGEIYSRRYVRVQLKQSYHEAVEVRAYVYLWAEAEVGQARVREGLES